MINSLVKSVNADGKSAKSEVRTADDKKRISPLTAGWQLLKQALHFLHGARSVRIGCEVFQFVRIAERIQEHCAGSAFVPLDVMPMVRANGFAELPLKLDHREGWVR